MDLLELDTAFRVWVVLALAVGAFLLTLGNAFLGSVGVVLVILGLMGLMPIVRNGMSRPTDVRADVSDRPVAPGTPPDRVDA